MTASERISVEYGGVEVTHPLAREQISTTVWAALRKQEYVVGSQCRVMVRLSEGQYEIEAVAKEPTTDWLRLLDLVVPVNGIDAAEYERFLNEQGLAPFATPPDDAVLVGGDPRKSHPDTAMVGKQAVPVVGRNDPCPCGSGKKYKKCCLQ